MNMNNAFQELFGPIHAEESLKNKTKAFLAEKTQGYAAANTGQRRYPLYAGAFACLLFMLFGGHWLYFTPTAQISVDINPSIEMSVNRFDQVILVTDFNEDGRALSRTLDVKYKNYTDAIEQILNHDTIEALLAENEVMTITVIGPDEQQSAKILSGVEACTAERRNTYCYFASSEDVAEAHKMGLSCGKYRAFLELEFLDPSITPEAVQNMTMREIRDIIDSLSADSVNPSSSYDNRGNGHHGYGGDHGQSRKFKETQN